MSQTPLYVRQKLVDALQADLVGPFMAEGQPGGGQEVLPLPPSRWYLAGFLAPLFDRVPDADDQEAVGELAAGSESQAEDAGNDTPETKRPHRFPASLGLSVFVPPGEVSIEAEVRFANYDKVEVAEDKDDKRKTGWKRVPRGPFVVEVPLDSRVLAGRDGVSLRGAVGVRLRGELRPTTIDGLPPGTRVLSLFLVNERAQLLRDRDLSFIFQVGLTLRCKGGFLARPNRRGEDAGEDDPRILALQFRDRFEWAVGHNTSVELPTPDADGVVRELKTTQLPRYEVRRVDHIYDPQKIGVAITGMRDLGHLDGDGLRRALTPLIEAYASWIERQKFVRFDRDSLAETRDSLMAKAEVARKRIAEGIALLASDPMVRDAFCLANRAMHEQAMQADSLRADRRYNDEKLPQWRPFQLAFVLLNLASVADPAHADRNVADLIYFPTGGGKTEAYLGLVAYTLVLRRLRGKSRPDEGRGVAVLLRYTLRLLTLDQLGRAATLICALEQLRHRMPERLGNTRFAVGLWVGKSATANRLRDVHKVLSDRTPGKREMPFPLPECPWCGRTIRRENIKLVDDRGKPSATRYTRAVVYCDRPKGCAFTERARPGQGLPVLFVDEQIYRELPDFVVATVDKFAMMPWRGEAGMLFGRATHIDKLRAHGVMHDPPKDAKQLPQGLYPPELIIQDELHLISGPLGTMVGLYEAAIDYLSAREVDGVLRTPKIVCSTATARRAREQIRALFNREMAIFPPRGIDDGDNFFSAVDRKSPGRLYVGVAASGRALRAVSVRTYAVLLAAAQRHFDANGALDQPADPYMTLVGYFNSLRELGGMRRLVEDEVGTRVRNFAEGKRPHHHISQQHPWAASRELLMPAELTSREPTDRVKETKARLATRRAAKGDKVFTPLDVVLASNMISVGLDIDRLGLMVVAGQPKTTSEYIQATSRVGRKYPGLVVTCLNASRPRDRSHYERFAAYHESFYREVEATSVTPFSLQTLDRGMVGTLLSMIRHGLIDMSSPTGFMRIHQNRRLAEEVLERLVTRGCKHREWHDQQAEQRIADELRSRGKNFLDAWERIRDSAIEGGASRTYSGLDRAGRQGKAVMYFATDDRPDNRDERKFVAPTSMRDVEPSTHLWLRFAPLDERR